MKKKLTAVLLCITLLLTLTFNVSADTTTDNSLITDAQATPITDDITVAVEEGNSEHTFANEAISKVDQVTTVEDSSTVTATTAATPIGSLDTVTSSVIGGWAYRSDMPNSPLEIHIYITNNSTSEQTVYTTVANIYRPDLESAGYGNGYHSFHYTMDWLTFKPGTYTVRAYAIGANGNNPQLTNSPKKFTVRALYGGVDGVGDYIIGWVWKPDAPNGVVEAHIYIYRPNGEQVFVLGVNANRYRSDVEAAGYGTGKYGFACPVDWNSLPEEKLNIKVYAVDWSGTHPLIYNGYYDNRMPITLLGMIDNAGIDHSTWMWNDDIVTYCENIGCSALKRFNCADATDENYSYSRFIRESSYCAIVTHGQKTGIQWSMRQLYNDHIDCQNKFCSTCYGWYTTTEHLNELPNNYFANTRCVVSTACETAKGGKTDSANFVNVLHSKGVDTVVGFEKETWFFYDPTTLQTIDTKGSLKWLSEFTRLLGEGNTVDISAQKAYETTLKINLAAAGYTMEQYNNDDIPEDDLVEKVVCGLDSYCVVGDGSQIIKH